MHTNEQLEGALRKAARAALTVRGELDRERARNQAPVAIVGVGFRLPGGAVDLGSLWEVLCSGSDTVREIPLARFDLRGRFHEDPEHPGTSYVKHAALIDDVGGFDASLFGISPREARALDPQHRLLLESTWAALEDAGFDPQSLRDSTTGLFVAIGPNEYDQHRSGSAADADAHAITGAHTAFAAGRVAYHLGLQGPAIAVDTACSSALVALHLATDHLRSGRCDLALAGGVQVIADPDTFVHLSRTHAVAPDGRCKTFSDRADGYGRGEGVVVFTLMRLEDALRERRRILGVVRGTAVNHDGASAGITAPNGTSQQKVIRQALDNARLQPADVDVVECHGTGTSLGDPIEVHALDAVYGRARPRDAGPLLLGAVKTTLGHLESAAGAVGVLKILASFVHGALPPTLHCSPRNRNLPWDELNVQVVDSLTRWPRCAERVRRAGVSSFGLSGTNAHVVLEEPPELTIDAQLPGSGAALGLVALSGHTEAALQANAAKLAQALSGSDHPPAMAELAHSLVATRASLALRLAYPVLQTDAAAGYPELRAALSLYGQDGTLSRGGHVTPMRHRTGKLGFLFTGQGSQLPGMGRELYGRAGLEAFTEAFDAALAALDKHLDRSLRQVMWSDANRIHSTRYTQPSLFAIELSLYRQWEAWGFRASVVAGHSIGELTAAHVAGVLELDDAARLVCARAQLMDELAVAGGAMVSIQADEAEVQEVLDQLEMLATNMGFTSTADGVSIASLNGPTQTVISGDVQLVSAVVLFMEERGRKCKPLNVSHAFHSPHIAPMLAEFRQVCESVTFHSPVLPVISNVTGELAEPERGELVSPAYWVEHVRGTVRFAQGIEAALRHGVRTFVECGPDGVLSALVVQCIGDERMEREGIRAHPSLRKAKDELSVLGSAVAGAYALGHGSDVQSMPSCGPARRLSLPVYAFQRQTFWRDLPEPTRAASEDDVTTAAGPWPLSGRLLQLPDGEALHLVEVGPGAQGYLADHLVYDTIVIPGAFYLSVFLAVAAHHHPDHELELSDVQFHRALTFQNSTERVTLQIHLRSPDAAGQRQATLVAYQNGVWTTHATARLAAGPTLAGSATTVLGSLALESDAEGLFGRLSDMQVSWGPRWRWLRGTALAGERTYARIVPPAGTPKDDAPLAGCLVDTSFALLLDTTFGGAGVADGVPFLPFRVDRIVCRPDATAASWASCVKGRTADALVVGDLSWFDDDGQLLARMEGFAAHRAPADRFLAKLADERDLFAIGQRVVAEPVSKEVATPTRLAVETLADLAEGLPLAAHVWLDIRLGPDTDPGAATVAMVSALQNGARNDGESRLVKLTVCTENALYLSEQDAVPRLAQAALWGVLRTLRVERPELSLCLIDSDGHPLSHAVTGSWFRAGEFALRMGRLVQPELQPVAALATNRVPAAIGEGTVLITGGTGGLAGAVAEHLVMRHQTKRLVLASRSGADAPGASALCERLRALGAESVIMARCDVSDRKALEALLQSVSSVHPLSGVIHAAGVLRDGLLDVLSAESVREVFAPKVDAARHLDELTRPLASVRAFILFSSLAGLIGNSGQGSYAAANAALDAIAVGRRRAGYPATSLAWGPWAEVGMAASLKPTDQARIASGGIRPLSLRAGLGLLDSALARPETVLAGVRIDASSLVESHLNRLSLIAQLLRHAAPASRPSHEPVTTNRANLKGRLAATPIAERRAAMVQFVRGEIAHVLGLSGAEQVSADKPLQEAGFDSLMSVDLRHRLSARSGVTLPATLAFDYPTPDALAGFLMDELFSEPEPSWSEADIRAKLQRVPIDALRRLGVLDALMALPREDVHDGASPDDSGNLIRNVEDVSLLALAESMLRRNS